MLNNFPHFIPPLLFPLWVLFVTMLGTPEQRWSNRKKRSSSKVIHNFFSSKSPLPSLCVLLWKKLQKYKKFKCRFYLRGGHVIIFRFLIFECVEKLPLLSYHMSCGSIYQWSRVRPHSVKSCRKTQSVLRKHPYKFSNNKNCKLLYG